MNALALEAYEGRGRLRKASGSCLHALIRRYPNEETLNVLTFSLKINKIVLRRQPGEVKHLSNPRKRKSPYGDHFPSSGERTGRSLNLLQL